MKKESQQVDFVELIVLGLAMALVWVVIDKTLAFFLGHSLSASQLHTASTFIRGAVMAGVISVFSGAEAFSIVNSFLELSSFNMDKGLRGACYEC